MGQFNQDIENDFSKSLQDNIMEKKEFALKPRKTRSVIRKQLLVMSIIKLVTLNKNTTYQFKPITLILYSIKRYLGDVCK